MEVFGATLTWYPELQVSAMTPLCVTTKLNKSGEGHHTVSSRFGSGSEASDFKVV